MFRTRSLLPMTALAATILVAGCATTPRAGPVDVTRYHLGGAIPAGTVAVEPVGGQLATGPEYRTYADAVQAEMARLGFAAAADPRTADYVAAVGFQRRPVGTVEKPAPVSIGVGGGGISGGRRGGGVGLGGGVGFGIGGGTREVLATDIVVQLRRQGDATVIWDGKATTQAIARTDAAQPIAQAQKVASALFRDFPGESGITITVK
ncbi:MULTISPECIES: DUF4136 domain-containing protein [unclassified Sphingomonas]|uniref:DUF4136 domain-containing protein n=1 Tax=unclassified Sphingomonas TaxID=196159 RepID=UPI000830C7AC|nr:MULTISPECIES: DUF4136 domain-containing protein [unclassified Sphingomonas]